MTSFNYTQYKVDEVISNGILH